MKGWYWALAICLILFGFLIDRVLHNWAFISFENSIEIIDVFGLLVTGLVGVSIPYIIGKTLQDQSGMSAELVREFAVFEERLQEFDIIFGVFDFTDPTEFYSRVEQATLKFESLDNEFDSLLLFVEDHCKSHTRHYLPACRSQYMKFWELSTEPGLTELQAMTAPDREELLKRIRESFQQLKDKLRRSRVSLYRGSGMN